MKLIEKITNKLKGRTTGSLVTPGIVPHFFVQRNIDFDGVVDPGGTKLLEWEIHPDYDATYIDDIVPGCGCTAKITWSGNKVTAVFSNTKNPGTKVSPVKKSMRVYFRDGIPKEPNASGSMVWPKERKLNTVLTFEGQVKGKD